MPDPNAAMVALGRDLEHEVEALTEAMQRGMIEHIPELRGDHTLVDLLRVSVLSNLTALVQVLSYQIEPDRIPTPLGASEYARRLAQHGVSVTALVRAYRLGHRDLIAWALAKWQHPSADAETQQVPLAAVAELTRISSGYIDSISEQVIAEYTAEREQWLAHRDRARAEVLTRLTADEPVDLDHAERVLGYRLHQHHLGLTLWSADHAVRPVAGTFETAGALVAESLGASTPLLWPQDAGSTWAWLPLGSAERARAAVSSIPDAMTALAEHARHGPQFRVALGTVAAGADGFRATHHEARRAQQVATVPDGPQRFVTSYTEPGVRAASLLVTDLAATRRLVAATLGDLADDTDRAARLRQTVLTLIQENGSLTRTAERLHLHKNSVKYRVRQAVELRGRPIEEDRWDLELALHGCQHLAGAVLGHA